MNTFKSPFSSNKWCPRERKELAELISGLLKSGFNAKSMGSYGRLENVLLFCQHAVGILSHLLMLKSEAACTAVSLELKQ